METQIQPEITKKKQVTQPITPFLWFDNQAEEAARFYTGIFNDARIKMVNHYSEEGAKMAGLSAGAVMTVAFQIEGMEFVALNGGPMFQIGPTISFFVYCDHVAEIDLLWSKLSEDGQVFMPLDKYHFSERYGWIQDKFGVSWQLILHDSPQKIVPCFMFTGEQHIKAEEAIGFYTSVFQNSKIILMERYQPGQGPEGAVVHGKFLLDGQVFIAMDSHEKMAFGFNPAISFVVNCDTQEQIDYFWTKLSEGGDEKAQQCGWLQDKFGVSWQIVPSALGELLNTPDPAKSGKVMQALLQMKKIDIETLRKAQN